MTEDALLCHRCGCTLQSGRGAFYLVTIEAIADPSPLDLDQDLFIDSSEGFAEAVAELEGFSESELMDQVRRKMVLHLCPPCYRKWIEDPVGQA